MCGVELKDCLYSRNTLNSLTKLLISQDYDEYIKEMTRRDLDWRNPLGEETYKCFRYTCGMEKNMLEAARDNGGFSTVPAVAPLTTATGSNTSAKSKSKCSHSYWKLFLDQARLKLQVSMPTSKP